MGRCSVGGCWSINGKREVGRTGNGEGGSKVPGVRCWVIGDCVNVHSGVFGGGGGMLACGEAGGKGVSGCA